MLSRALALMAACAIASSSIAHANNLFDKVKDGITGTAKKVEGTVTDATSGPTASEIDGWSDAALQRLFASSEEAKQLSNKSVAILVFPRVAKGGLMVGGQYGEGVMRQAGAKTGYFSIAGASYGLQIGVQRFSYAMFFLNEAALDHFYKNNGWEAGAGPTLVGGEKGWSSSMGTNDLQGDIVPVFWGQEGLMAGGGLQGIKITKIEK